jgi:hypothetical protein
MIKYIIYLSSLFEPKYNTVISVTNDSISFHDGYSYRKEKILSHNASLVYVVNGASISKHGDKIEIYDFKTHQIHMFKIRKYTDYTRN